MRTAGHAGGIGDPAGIAAHHLHHDHAVVRVGGGVDAVDGLGGDHDRGVEPEGGVGAVDVVVDRLGYAHAGHAVLAEEHGHRLRVVSPKRDQCVNLVGFENFLDLVDAAGNLFHVGPRRVQDGATLQLDAIGAFQGEGNPIVVKHAAPAVEKADELIAIVIDAFFDGRIDHGIQPGAISSAGQ